MIGNRQLGRFDTPARRLQGLHCRSDHLGGEERTLDWDRGPVAKKHLLNPGIERGGVEVATSAMDKLTCDDLRRTTEGFNCEQAVKCDDYNDKCTGWQYSPDGMTEYRGVENDDFMTYRFDCADHEEPMFEPWFWFPYRP